RLLLDDRFHGTVVALHRTRREVPPAAAPARVQAQVDEDSIEPGRKARLAAKRSRRLVQPDEGILRKVTGLLGIAEDRPGQAVGALLVAFDEHVERVVVTLRHPLAQGLIAELHSRDVPWPSIVTDPVEAAQADGLEHAGQ